MKLRIAKKLCKIIGTPREARYSDRQLHRALDVVERTRSSRRNREYWHYLMERLGPLGRAQFCWMSQMRGFERKWGGE